MRQLHVCALLLCLGLSTQGRAGPTLIYTAHQDWPSRIYLMDMNGVVIDFHEYDFYRICDVAVVENELYITDAFAPRVYKVDVETGDLEVIIDDWSLYYFYGLAFDGTYFYVDEWDLNRYDIDGDFAGRASFDETVFGSACIGDLFFMLNDENQVKCWDLSTWPSLTEIPELGFTPPSPHCRGLWYDGSAFWSAESQEGLGTIYRFDATGQILHEWNEPAFRGWGACVLQDPASVEALDRYGQTILELEPVSPNPIRSKGTIRFFLHRPARVAFDVFDPLGRRVAEFPNRFLEAGSHRIDWSPIGLCSGVYICRVEADGVSATRKILVVD